MNYYPEGWALVKITNKETGSVSFKVFGGWGGGYAYGDSWKLNSGVVEVIEHPLKKEKEYEFVGHSGSRYFCGDWLEGRLTMYCQAVLNGFIEDVNKAEESKTSVEVVKLKDSGLSINIK